MLSSLQCVQKREIRWDKYVACWCGSVICVKYSRERQNCMGVSTPHASYQRAPCRQRSRHHANVRLGVGDPKTNSSKVPIDTPTYTHVGERSYAHMLGWGVRSSQAA
ncbi:hypothetical protein RJT34_17714 [Clitoria ternatea]|uniref:Uncharacterized protein n=1 Tax=Clitoria ternatea TaxID=43366 RepID=A0AAN9J9V1_CLITE